MMHPKKIIISGDAETKIIEDAKQYGREGLESGGYLYGKILPGLIYEITEFVDAGPNADRGPASYSGDNEYAAKKMKEFQEKDPNIRLGEYHLHPWQESPYPSGIDLRQLQEIKGSVRPWFVILLAGKNGYKIWDLDESAKAFIEVPYQTLPRGLEIREKDLLNRIMKITQHNILSTKTVSLIGLGSLGSPIAKYLGTTGIGRFILVDSEDLETVNVIRHEGMVEDIGKSKTEICKRVIEGHNPFTILETHRFDVIEERERLEEIITKSDLVISSSGSPRVNNLINKICIEKEVPAVYSGIYEKAKGGYVLSVPSKETACFNCIFNLTSSAYHIDRETAHRYGISEEELHEQQGLWMDISIPALMLSKTALMMLQGEALSFNLLLYESPFTIKKLNVAKREDCAVCNFEGWMKKIQGSSDRVEIDLHSIPKLSRKKKGRLSWLKELMKKIS